MRPGLIFFGLLILIALVAIAGLLYRPATVIGVSGKALAYSVHSAADSGETGACRGREDEWDCTAIDDGSNSPLPVLYRVTTDDYGCWEGKRREGGAGSMPQALEGCITIMDLVRLDD